MINTLKKLEEAGWVYSQVHPSLSLSIWNYSDKTQYEGYWTDVTLAARGLVLDNTTGEVVSRGFSKFFNYSEGKTKLPKTIGEVTVFEKLDGSYIGLFFYDGQWVVNSKGSFNSDHVGWAWELLEGRDLSVLDKDFTYCFELITKNNRIVCSYNFEDLVFLAAFNNKTGKESDLKSLKGFISPRNHKSQSFSPETLQQFNIKNEEGYVVKFQNGERCKIKFEEYIKLHSLYTKTSTVDIWECMKDGGNIYKIIEDAPDEIFDFIKGVVSEITENFHSLKSSIEFEYETISSILGDCTDKEFALAIKDNKNSSFLFALRNRKDIDKQIWKKIKPERKTYSKF